MVSITFAVLYMMHILISSTLPTSYHIPRHGLPAMHVSKVVQKLRMTYQALDGEDALRYSGCGAGRSSKSVWNVQMMTLDDIEGCTRDREGGRSQGVKERCSWKLPTSHCYPYDEE